MVFESEPQRIWRIRKTFGDHPQAFLEESRDGVDFHVEARGRDVDGRLSEILRWGLAPPGGKGRPKGMPVTFLSTALLAEQDEVGAIFSRALSGDSDESGKKLLIEALQAAAEDPLFKSVLQLVQARVDEAFASSGQRRRGKDSPWIKLREQIRLAEEDERQCREQLQKSTAIESELQDLLSRRLECEVVLTKAIERLKYAESEHNQIIKRGEIALRLRECHDRLQETTLAIQKCSEANSQHAELSQKVTRLLEKEKEAQLSLIETAKRAETAREHFRMRSADQALERQLKQNALEKNRADLLSEQVSNNAAVSRLQTIQSLAERTRAIETAADQLAKRIGELKVKHTEATKASRELDDREAEGQSIVQLIRRNLAKAGIGEAEKALAQIEEWREQARQNRTTAIGIESTIDKMKLPQVAEIDSLKDLKHQLQIAQARVGVGLQLSLRPKRELYISIRRDGGDLEQTVLREGILEATATGEIQLDIHDLAEITLSGGAESDREESARLQMRWTAEGEPALRQGGFTSLDDVLVAAKARTRSAEEIQTLRHAADALDQRISDQRDWSTVLAERKLDLASAEADLVGKDHRKFEAIALKLGINDLAGAEAHLAKLGAQRPTLAESERILGGDLTAAEALNTEKQKDLISSRKELDAAQAAFEGYSKDLLSQLLDEQSNLSRRSIKVQEELQTLDAEIDNALAEARGALEAAENEHLEAETRHREIAEELRTTESKKASAEGEIRILGEVAAKLDESAARQAVVATEAELAGVPLPTRQVSDEMLEELRSTANSVLEELKDIEGAIKEKRGALKHVGGQVAKERTEDAQEALTILREKERDLEIDYDAWALLRQTLLDAEQEEGVHLGRVLGDPIVQRFSDLTEGRYGSLALGPDLETDTISAAGEGRSVHTLSVGTRDQLSIIFRVTLAEQLRSALVLDDQLTQSDAQRMIWLRNLIREMATNIQILVFTCRPADYLAPSEMKPGKKLEHFNAAVRSVDLTRVIERSGLQV